MIRASHFLEKQESEANKEYLSNSQHSDSRIESAVNMGNSSPQDSIQKLGEPTDQKTVSTVLLKCSLLLINISLITVNLSLLSMRFFTLEQGPPLY